MSNQRFRLLLRPQRHRPRFFFVTAAPLQPQPQPAPAQLQSHPSNCENADIPPFITNISSSFKLIASNGNPQFPFVSFIVISPLIYQISLFRFCRIACAKACCIRCESCITNSYFVWLFCFSDTRYSYCTNGRLFNIPPAAATSHHNL